MKCNSICRDLMENEFVLNRHKTAQLKHDTFRHIKSLKKLIMKAIIPNPQVSL